MKLADEIEKINKQSRMICDIKKEVSKIMDDLEA